MKNIYSIALILDGSVEMTNGHMLKNHLIFGGISNKFVYKIA